MVVEGDFFNVIYSNYDDNDNELYFGITNPTTTVANQGFKFKVNTKK